MRLLPEEVTGCVPAFIAVRQIPFHASRDSLALNLAPFPVPQDG